MQQLSSSCCVTVVLHEGCWSVMGSADVLGTVPAASVESGIVICIHLSQRLFMQWCHAPV